ncbi:phosphatidylinositol-specific phospholipase C domain-containing protein [Streptomyces sp. NPDC127061]|uniref:phosphatidylinositol-specific phospholipase C domain-containing protein n=1 Tax=Streptomyces sp. NPDC127061 TaxID=3347122 RepID=UPI0036627426
MNGQPDGADRPEETAPVPGYTVKKEAPSSSLTGEEPAAPYAGVVREPRATSVPAPGSSTVVQELAPLYPGVDREPGAADVADVPAPATGIAEQKSEPGEEPVELTGGGTAGLGFGQALTSVPLHSEYPLNSWMSRIPDTVRLSDMSIPGSHETCAKHDDTAFGFARCQAQDLEWQLNNGVRFVDIRCYYGSTNTAPFTIYHGSVTQYLTFDDVLKMTTEFLQRNPSETILMRISQERSSVSDETFRQKFEGSYLDRGWRQWFHIDANRIPNLGEVRRKIVLMTRNPYIGGLDLDGHLFDTQDKYEVSSHMEKLDAVMRQIDNVAHAAMPRGKMYLNYTSASNPPAATPWDVAKVLNERVHWVVKNKTYLKGRELGVVPMDYVDRHTSSTSGGYTNLMSGIIKFNQIRPFRALNLTATVGEAATGLPRSGLIHQSFRIDTSLAGISFIFNGYTGLYLNMDSDGRVFGAADPLSGIFRLVPQDDGSTGIRKYGSDKVLTMENRDGPVTGTPYRGVQSQSFRIVTTAGNTEILNSYY